MKYQCSKTGEFVTPGWGWTHCPFCGEELKPRKHFIPEPHEVWEVPDRESQFPVPRMEQKQ